MTFFTHKRSALLLLAAVGAVWMFGCGDGSNPESVAGNNGCTSAGTCKSVTIGGVKWMAENLNIQTVESWCYGGDNSNCAKYGRLYTWEAAKSACPAGWRLPSRDEWDTLATRVGGTKNAMRREDVYHWANAGKKLKAKSGWNDGGNGSDDVGFSALPGGCRGSGDSILGDSFYLVGDFGFWWTATERDAANAYERNMGWDDEGMVDDYGDKNVGFSVRCVGN
jgi:uncharacterized protein (TIGR02145 family)